MARGMVGEGDASGVPDSGACVDAGEGAEGEESDAVWDLVRWLLWGEGYDEFTAGTQRDYEVSRRRELWGYGSWVPRS